MLKIFLNLFYLDSVPRYPGYRGYHLFPSLVTPARHGPPPPHVTNAAVSLNSQLNSGLGHIHNLGYQPLTLDQLRKGPATSANADILLHQEVRNVAPLNPAGVGSLPGVAVQSNQVRTVEQLYAATMRNKQLKAFEFAASGQFSYKNQLKQDNLNAILFAYGSFKHLEAAKLGLISMSDTEFLARLTHLKNVFEIACLSSSLTSYSDNSWHVAREYDTRVISDIESGSKSWSSLSKGLETDALYCANQTVDLRNKGKVKAKDSKDNKKVRGDKEAKKACTTFNTHRSSEGCYWEHNNRGENCIFEHFCSWFKETSKKSTKCSSVNSKQSSNYPQSSALQSPRIF